jgi:hypothetical protein
MASRDKIVLNILLVYRVRCICNGSVLKVDTFYRGDFFAAAATGFTLHSLTVISRANDPSARLRVSKFTMGYPLTRNSCPCEWWENASQHLVASYKNMHATNLRQMILRCSAVECDYHSILLNIGMGFAARH